jgi:hypothetical protein
VERELVEQVKAVLGLRKVPLLLLLQVLHKLRHTSNTLSAAKPTKADLRWIQHFRRLRGLLFDRQLAQVGEDRKMCPGAQYRRHGTNEEVLLMIQEWEQVQRLARRAERRMKSSVKEGISPHERRMKGQWMRAQRGHARLGSNGGE